jgi:hypothetical protein
MTEEMPIIIPSIVKKALIFREAKLVNEPLAAS